MSQKLKDFLDRKVKEYNRPSFIDADPICIPHSFSKKQDIEIAGFFAAIFAWGNRSTIISKTKELMICMDNAPHEFMLHHSDADLKNLLNFKHRTFNPTDLLYFIQFFKHHYSVNTSLESAFFNKKSVNDQNKVEAALSNFHHYFFSLPNAPARTKKHIATPEKHSTCKRLNMFLRWMVRKDKCGVDFGIWKKITPAELICPIDVHVARVARRFILIQRNQVDWLTATELTNHLKRYDAEDPVKYDFALFTLGAVEKF